MVLSHFSAYFLIMIWCREVKIVRDLIEKLKSAAHLTGGAFLELFRGQPEEPLIVQGLQFEHLVPDDKIETAFDGALKQIQGISLDAKINHLMAKAAQTGLSDEERLELSQTISKRKPAAIFS